MMNKKSRTILKIIGAYEIFFSIKLLWNVGNGRMNSIIIGDNLILGVQANIAFLTIAMLGLCVGFGLMKLHKWSFYGFISLSVLLISVYLSNLLLIDFDSLVGFYGTVPDNYLADFRQDILRRLFVVFCLALIVLFARKPLVSKKRLTNQ